jgi:hypothetical protein
MRLKEMGKEFLRYGDSSPEGLKRFAEEKGLGLDEMQALVQMMSKFRRYQKETSPKWSDPVAATGEGGKPGYYQISEEGRARPIKGIRPKPETKNPSATMEKISLLVSQGVPLDRATKIATGAIRYTTDQMGNRIRADLTQPASSVKPPLGSTGGAGDVPKTQSKEERDQPSFITEKDLIGGTGPISGIRQTLNNLVGWATEGVPFEDTADARNKLRTFKHNAIQALVVNPRAPIAEQRTIQGFLPDPDKFFRDPDQAVKELSNLRNFLLEQKSQKEKAMVSGRISNDQLRTYQDQINNITSVLNMMPDFNEVGSSTGVQGDMDFSSMTPDELKSVDVGSLSDEKLDAFINAVTNMGE